MENQVKELESELENPNKEIPIREVLKYRKKLIRLIDMYNYIGVDPKDIDRSTLLELVKQPDHYDNVEKVYRDRIKNPMTAVRAFCVLCCGGVPSAVKSCAKVNCPLWALRLGKNNYSTRKGNPEALQKFKDSQLQELGLIEDDDEEVHVPD